MGFLLGQDGRHALGGWVVLEVYQNERVLVFAAHTLITFKFFPHTVCLLPLLLHHLKLVHFNQRRYAVVAFLCKVDPSVEVVNQMRVSAADLFEGFGVELGRQMQEVYLSEGWVVLGLEVAVLREGVAVVDVSAL